MQSLSEQGRPSVPSSISQRSSPFDPIPEGNVQEDDCSYHQCWWQNHCLSYHESCAFFLTALLLLVCFSMLAFPFPMTINESRRSGLVQPTHVVAVEAPSDISIFWIFCKHQILGDINQQNSGLGSGAAVRPNSELSQLTHVPTLSFCTH